MPARRKTGHDFTILARKVVEKAIGEQMNGKPLIDPDAGKNPAAIARGRAGGISGGPARARALSAVRRRKIAKKAARSRWKLDSRKKKA